MIFGHKSCQEHIPKINLIRVQSSNDVTLLGVTHLCTCNIRKHRKIEKSDHKTLKAMITKRDLKAHFKLT